MINKFEFKSKEEWLEFRKNGIGGSEAAILFDESPYFSKEDLRQYKLQDIVQEENGILGFGNRMEDVIFTQFVKRDIPEAVAYNDTCFVNDKYEKLQASPDALTNDLVIEIKFVNLLGSAKWKDENGEYKLLKHYWHQVQHYMAVLEKTSAKVYVFFQDLNDIKIFNVDINKDYIYNLNIAAIDFIESLSSTTYIPKEVSTPAKESETLAQLHKINQDINNLQMKKKALNDSIISAHEPGDVLNYGALKGKIYERSGKSYLKIS